MKTMNRVVRAGITLLIMFVLDRVAMNQAWAIIGTSIATYFAFTAYTGECLVREYLPSLVRIDKNK